MLALIARGITLGLTAGILPGPLQTFLIQTTLTQGGRRGIVAVFSPLLSDIPIILLTVLVLAQFPPEFIRVVQIAGGLFVLWLARAAWLSFRAGVMIGAGGEAQNMSVRDLLLRGLMINLLSPGPYIFWGTVNGPLLVDGMRESRCTARRSRSRSTARSGAAGGVRGGVRPRAHARPARDTGAASDRHDHAGGVRAVADRAGRGTPLKSGEHRVA
ncbi:MAG: LysE family transporter [Anaerolineae bacterium]|nr:LysE family transporter [Anaerolineae bacterium]